MFSPTKFLRAGLLLALVISATTFARAQNINREVADMRQELQALRERVGDLQTTVEALRSEVAEMRSAVAVGKQSYATVNQLHDALAEVNRIIKDSNTVTKTVSTKVDNLVKETNAALADMTKNINAARRANTGGGKSGGGKAQQTTVTFSNNYPKEGISYTVQPGDNLSTIARKTGAKTKDIQNANQIADPTKLMPGQVLFIPGAKEPEPPSPVAPSSN